MQFSGYEFSVVGGRETPDGYVYLDHGQAFGVHIENPHIDRRVVAIIAMNGEEIGRWQLARRNSRSPWHGIIERPMSRPIKFRAYAKDSAEGAQVGGDSLPIEDAGIISVTYIPEKLVVRPRPPFHPYQAPEGYSDMGPQGIVGSSNVMYDAGVLQKGTPRGAQVPTSRATGATAGVIGGDGYSDQTFSPGPHLDPDHEHAVRLELRVVIDVKSVGPQALTHEPISRTSQLTTKTAPPPIE